jgi:hypothetical protein
MLKEKLKTNPDLAETIQQNITRESLQDVELPESVEEQVEQFEPSDSLLERNQQNDKSLLERR